MDAFVSICMYVFYNFMHLCNCMHTLPSILLEEKFHLFLVYLLSFYHLSLKKFEDNKFTIDLGFLTLLFKALVPLTLSISPLTWIISRQFWYCFVLQIKESADKIQERKWEDDLDRLSYLST